MKIGIDFGTSYTCAAAWVDGQVVHINFGSSDQLVAADGELTHALT